MRAFENHKQWTAVKDVCRVLRGAGFKALLAGGSVRDLLMSREPHDFDIATDATPDQVEGLFPRAIAVGKAFGVMILPYDGFQLEVATFREDLDYKDGRRPEGVRFSSPEVDAKRRDFTVNALFLDPESGEVSDFVEGQADIGKRLIRTVGQPEKRFSEDKLRLLRAVRLAAQLDFTIDPRTWRAIQELANEIEVVSRERVRDELLKLLNVAGRVKGLDLLLDSGLLKSLFSSLWTQLEGPLASPNAKSLWLRCFSFREALADDEMRRAHRLALFFWPVWQASFAKDPVSAPRVLRDENLKELRLENKVIESILFIFRNFPEFSEPHSHRRGHLAKLLQSPYAPAAESFVQALEFAHDQNANEPVRVSSRQTYLDELRSHALNPDGTPVSPWVTGTDAKAMGLEPGPGLGQILNEALLLQMEGAFANREAALKWLSEQSPSPSRNRDR